MIDLHAHILPGLDDGPSTMGETLALVDLAHELGTRAIVATPHVDERHRNTAAAIAAAVAELNRTLEQRGTRVAIVAGAEVAVSRLGDLSIDELRALSLAGNRSLLLESPLEPGAGGVQDAVAYLVALGLRPVLAHPERSPLFLRDPGVLSRAVEAGALTSVTAGALIGRFGSAVERFALWMLREGLAHDIASDAHDVSRRPPGMAVGIAHAAERLPGLREHAEWLTRAAPGAILAGEPLPARPSVPLRPTRRSPLGR